MQQVLLGRVQLDPHLCAVCLSCSALLLWKSSVYPTYAHYARGSHCCRQFQRHRSRLRIPLHSPTPTELAKVMMPLFSAVLKSSPIRLVKATACILCSLSIAYYARCTLRGHIGMMLFIWSFDTCPRAGDDLKRLLSLAVRTTGTNCFPVTNASATLVVATSTDVSTYRRNGPCK